MSDESPFVAGVLRSSSAALSGFAADELLDSHPQMAQTQAADAFLAWKNWFGDRIEDLIAAISTATVATFVEQMKWAQSLLVARGRTPEDFHLALNALQTVLQTKLPPGSQHRIASFLQPALDACQQGTPDEPTRLVPDTPDHRLAANYLLALLEGDHRQATEMLVSALAEGRTLAELYQQVLAPALAEVGRMWVAREISIADEHFVTTATRDTMARLRSGTTGQRNNGRTVLAAAVAGNQHDIGLQMLADLFELAGWRAINLGANVPATELVHAVQDFSADLLLLSAALPIHLTAVRDTVSALRASPMSGVKILVGGPAFRTDPDLALRLGADGCAIDGDAAIAIAERLLVGGS